MRDNAGKIITIIVILTSVGIMMLFLYIATTRTLTQLEAYGFQLLSLFAGLTGSYIFGHRISKKRINEIVEPYSRPAFRRLISLYQSLSRVAFLIDDDKEDSIKIQIIEAIVYEQIAAASDALADWEDIAPKSVEELKKQSISTRPTVL